MGNAVTVGSMLRQWREHRRLSQLALACNAEISTRHLSFLETGRAQPSREMIVRLAEEMRVPLRQRNAMLMAGGYAQIYPERSLNDPSLERVDRIVQITLAGHEPNPALAIDFRWNVMAMNRASRLLIEGVDPALLRPPVNAMRVALHPAGLAPRIRNFAAWRAGAVMRVRQQIEATADPQLRELFEEIQSYPYEQSTTKALWEPAMSLEMTTSEGDVRLMTTTMVFGSPQDVTVSEIAIECFFPVDQASAEVMKKLCS